jgi:hypothetical protein
MERYLGSKVALATMHGKERALARLFRSLLGSFDPHPGLPFLAAGLEVMVFVDQERGLEIWERLIARRTNFAHRCATELAESVECHGF